MPGKIDALKERFYDLDALGAALGIMGWDQQTYMPAGGAAARAEHVGRLSSLYHATLTDDITGKLIDDAAAEAAPGSLDAALVRVTKRSYDLATKLPTELVARKAKLSAEGHEVWVQARKNNDFKAFQPVLSEMFQIAGEEASLLGYSAHPYDALLDQFEEGATQADVRAMFDGLRGPIVGLLQEIQANGHKTDDHHLYGDFSVERQKTFTEHLIASIGFDLNRGRQDTAPHPFCTGWSVGDIRLTTRFENYVGSSIFGSLHEAGHGMYEQGSDPSLDRSPLCGGVSLGIHESQSRLWENIVGRSKPFWKYFLHEFQAAFPKLAAYGYEQFYKMINQVEPSLIRVEADEVTYNLHIMVRFEIECDVLTGKLDIKDMPEAWNAKYKEYLGVDVPNDAQGCLQDVHWSGGMIGYFPTYSIGNLLSYQFWAALKRDIPEVDEQIAAGNFAEILGWLRESIYRHGKIYTPKELVQRVTGKEMSADDYVAGLTAKYRDVYLLGG